MSNALKKENKQLKVEAALIEDEIPETFYRGMETRHRVAQLVRIWRNAIKEIERLRADLAAGLGPEMTVFVTNENAALKREVERLRDAHKAALAEVAGMQHYTDGYCLHCKIVKALRGESTLVCPRCNGTGATGDGTPCCK